MARTSVLRGNFCSIDEFTKTNIAWFGAIGGHFVRVIIIYRHLFGLTFVKNISVDV